MVCENCIHYGICNRDCHFCRDNGGEVIQLHDSQMVEVNCPDFKDNSRYIEVQCKVGDTVYQINTTPYGGEVCELEIFDVSLIKGKPYYETESIDFDNTAIGESIFLTREGAEVKLKGSAKWEY